MARRLGRVRGRGSGPRRSRRRRGSRDCTAAGASRRGRLRAAHRSGERPRRRTRSTTGWYLQRAGSAGRDRALVEADRRHQDAAQRAHASLPARPRGPPRRAPSAAPARSPARRPRAPARRAAGRATITKSWPGVELAGARPERLAQQPLDAVALDGAAELAPDRDPQPRLGLVVGARKRVDDQVPAGVRATLAVDAFELAAARQPAALAARAIGHAPRA